MKAEIRSALRIVAFDGPQPQAQDAMRRMDGAGDPIVWAAILRIVLDRHDNLDISDDDRRTLAVGTIVALAQIADDSRPWRVQMDRALKLGHDIGLSFRDLAAHAGVSHTAVRNRLVTQP